MNSTCLPATSSPTRCMRGRGSPGPCNAATDQSGSVDSVTMNTCGLSHGGAASGSVLTSSVSFVGLGPSGIFSASSGPVTESNGLRWMIGWADGRSRDVAAATGGGLDGNAAEPESARAAPNNCVAPAAWKYAASATNASTTPAKYFLSRRSKVTGPKYL